MKSVAIIGAGPSGLAAIKCCLEEDMEPTCWERGNEPGGLWTYREDVAEGISSVMKHTVANTGKEMNAFSDFPPPRDFPNFMHHTEMREYLRMYADAFDLLKHVRFDSEVVKVEPARDYEDAGRWSVSVRNTKTGDSFRRDYDAVMVCIGHHAYPKVPTFPGQEKFRGTVVHSHAVRDCDRFAGQRLVVVGIGNSGADVAVDSCLAAKKVYLSTRRGAWIHSRIGANGRPYDMDYASREKALLRPLASFDTLCDQIERQLNRRFDHEAYGLKPKHRVLNEQPTLNDFLPYCIVGGRVAVRGDLERFEEGGVVFAGEEDVTEVDVVVLATGYLIRFPFLGEVVKTDDNRVELYKYVIPPRLRHPTLGIIGLVQPAGPIAPVSEMQCRWFARVLRRKVPLPEVEDMLDDIELKAVRNRQRFVESSRHTIQIDWIPYMDELADPIGAKPNVWKMALADPPLFEACFYGPCLPYQYRLEGPHAWSGARDAILGYEERVLTPLNGNKKAIPKDPASSPRSAGIPHYIFNTADFVLKTLSFFHRSATFCFRYAYNSMLKIID